MKDLEWVSEIHSINSNKLKTIDRTINNIMLTVTNSDIPNKTNGVMSTIINILSKKLINSTERKWKKN